MEQAEIAKVAVSAATYSIDKPYDYLIPEPMLEKALPGVRVMVPFGRGKPQLRGCDFWRGKPRRSAPM